MIEGESMIDHVNEFNTIVSQLTSIKVKFDEEVSALLVLCSFLESWNSLVMVVSNSISSSNTLKFDVIVGVILSKETRQKSLGGSTSGSVLNAKSRGRSKERGKGSRGHVKS